MKSFSILAALVLSLFSPATSLVLASDTLLIRTSEGDIKVELNANACPQNVAAFKKRIAEKVYTDSSFHSTGETYIFGGKPGPMAKNLGESGNFSADSAPPGEFALPHKRGTLTVARTAGSCNPEKRSNSTQFTISLADAPKANGEYSAIGNVTEGLEIVEKIYSRLQSSDGKAAPIKIKEIKMVADNPKA